MSNLVKKIGINGGSFNINYSMNGGCDVDVAFSTDSNWIRIGTPQGGHCQVTIPDNSNGTSRYGYITPVVNGGFACDDKKISVNQAGCSCDSFPSFENKTISSNGINDNLICEFSLDSDLGDCFTLPNPIPSSTNFISNLRWEINGSEMYLYGTVLVNNGTNSRNVTITVPYKIGDTTCNAKSFTLTQLGTGCDCSSLSVTGSTNSSSGYSASSESVTTTLGKYEVLNGCGVSNITVNAYTTSNTANTNTVNWITNLGVDSSGNINGTLGDNNGSFNPRNAWIGITATIGGNTCNSSRFQVVQLGYVCEGLNLSQTSATWTCSETNVITVSASTTVWSVSTNAGNSSHFNFLIVNNNRGIQITPKSDNTYNYNIDEIVSIDYGPSPSITCTDSSLILVHSSGSTCYQTPCTRYELKHNGSHSCEGGNITFTLHETSDSYNMVNGGNGNGGIVNFSLVEATPYYTFTVYSNVEGAAVTWGNGVKGAIVNGYHKMVSTNNSPYTVTLEKGDITFNNNGASCRPNGIARIDKVQ